MRVRCPVCVYDTRCGQVVVAGRVVRLGFEVGGRPRVYEVVSRHHVAGSQYSGPTRASTRC